MGDNRQNPGEVSDQPPDLRDELLVNVFLVKGREDLVSTQVAIPQALFRESPAHAASQIFPQIGANFSPKEQRFLEHITCLYSGALRKINLNPIYVYIIVTEITTEVDGEERVNFCTPFFFRNNPCEGADEQFRNFSACFLRRMQELGRRRRRLISLVNEVVRKFGDSMHCEEVKEDSDVAIDCSICLRDYRVLVSSNPTTLSSSVLHHMHFQWLRRNGSCPLCRYRLIPGSSSPIHDKFSQTLKT